ncbi:MAG: hypothetical protein J7K96_13330 [Desulfobacteraceae bacterium]|nr:hypothetical protein [Desulfobacteraceae bacterium]
MNAKISSNRMPLVVYFFGGLRFANPPYGLGAEPYMYEKQGKNKKTGELTISDPF